MNPDGQILNFQRHLSGDILYVRLQNDMDNGIDLGDRIEQLTRYHTVFYAALRNIAEEIVVRNSIDELSFFNVWQALLHGYINSPTVHRKFAVKSSIGNKERRNLEINRRYIIGGNLCFSIENTETSIPSEFIELEKGSAMFGFEDTRGFEYMGLEFNHIYFNEEGGVLNFAAYTQEGDGPIQLQIMKDRLLKNNEFVRTKDINSAVSELFHALEEEIEVDNESGRIKDRARNDFIKLYFYADLDDIIEKIWTEIPELDQMENSTYAKTRFKQYARSALLNIAFDELGWLRKEDDIKEYIHDAQIYWTHAVSMCIKISALMSLSKGTKEADEGGLKIQPIRPRSRREKNSKTGNSVILPFYRINLQSDSARGSNSSIGRKPNQHAILVRGHTRRQPVKNLEKYPFAKKIESTLSDGSVVTNHTVLKWIMPFWKNRESEELGPEVGIVGTLSGTRSYAENAMGQIFTMAFSEDFIQDRTHDFIIGPEGERYRLDGYLPNLKVGIEVDGEQHRQYIPHFHRNGESDFLNQKKRDSWIKERCKENKVDLVVIDDSTWDLSPEQLLEIIKNKITHEKFIIIEKNIRESVIDLS